MPMRGKSINLFLMDGTASGRIKCTLANTPPKVWYESARDGKVAFLSTLRQALSWNGALEAKWI